MKIRTDFVTNSSSSSYVIQKRLDAGNGHVPICVSNEVTHEHGSVHWVDGSFWIRGQILEACLIRAEETGKRSDVVDNSQLAKYAADFWSDESQVVTEFYEDTPWRIEEYYWRLANEHMDKYCVYGEKHLEQWRGHPKAGYFWRRPRLDPMIRVVNVYWRKGEDDDSFGYYSARNKESFSYFNKYVRGLNVYLYNTEFKESLQTDMDYIYRAAGAMLAHSFEHAPKLLEKLREKNMIPIFVGELPKEGVFPTVPTDIWLLYWNPESDAVEDLIAIELPQLEAWLESYAAPASSGSLWRDIQDFIEKHAVNKEFDYEDANPLYRQYWDGISPGLRRSDLENIDDENLILSSLYFNRHMLNNIEKHTAADFYYNEPMSVAELDLLDCEPEEYDTDAMDKWELLRIQIEEMDFSVRTYNCLKRASINTVGDIVRRSKVELHNIRNLGKKSIEELIRKIEGLGLEFTEPPVAKEEETQ